MKKGFAFVEFFITIAITVIGASIILVYLVTHSNNTKFKPMYIKAVSTLSQAVLMAKAQSDCDFASAGAPCPEDARPLANAQTFCSIFNETLNDAKFLGKIKNITYSNNKTSKKYKIEKTDILDKEYKDYYAYKMKDGIIFAFSNKASSCILPAGTPLYQEGQGFYNDTNTNLKNCIGFIDVNGFAPPNKEVTCKKGNNLIDSTRDCIVDMSEKTIADIYPVIFYNSTVEPLTSAAKYVLNNSR